MRYLIILFLLYFSCANFAMDSAGRSVHREKSAGVEKIIALEGADAPTRLGFANNLVALLGEDKAAILVCEGAESIVQAIDSDLHSIIILTKAGIFDAANDKTMQGKKLASWPEELVKPTHIFLIGDGKNARNDPGRKALKRLAKKLRFSALFVELDSSFTADVANKIEFLLRLDLKILDPRKMATGNKESLRPYYETWKLREEAMCLTSKNYIKITPEPEKAPDFDNNIRQDHQCHFANIGKTFEYTKFNEPRHPPVSIGWLAKREAFDDPLSEGTPQAQDMPIAFSSEHKESYEYRLPESYKNFQEFVTQVANVWHALEPNAHKYYAYLSISHGTIPAWQHQRRPNIHSDGFQGARVIPKETGEYTFVVANAMPTVYYIESFDTSVLDPARDNFFAHFSKNTASQPMLCQRKYEIIMMDPYCLHAAVTNAKDKAVKRTFARIIYSTRKYDRIGNAHNPAFEYSWDMVKRDALQSLNEI